VIFRKAQNRIQDLAKLRRLIDLIDSETSVGLDFDVKGEIYEGLLEKNAQDTKSGRADSPVRSRVACHHARPAHPHLPCSRHRNHAQAGTRRSEAR